MLPSVRVSQDRLRGCGTIPSMGDLTVPLSQLLLDELNPRHRPVTTQEAALHEVVRRDPRKLLNLATDIAANGLSPIDRLIIMKSEDGKKFVVLEGNRRLAALRLLAKPAACPDSSYLPKFEAVSAVAAHRPTRVRCYEVASRDEARPLLERRHAGELGGIGVIRWSAMQRTRNSSAPGHQERVALTTLDWLDGKAVAGSNQHLAELLDAVAEEKFTTFGRLAGDPDFRAYCGFDIRGDVFTVTDTAENVVLRLSLVLDDFRSERKLTVTELKVKEQRLAYIETLRARMAGADESDVDNDQEADAGDDDDPGAGAGSTDGSDSGGDEGGPGGADQDEQEGEQEEEDKPPPMKLFVGASLSNCSLRVRKVLNEVQKIPIRTYPNSAAALIRMVIELAVLEAHDKCSWPAPPQKDPKLRHHVDNAIRQLDPSMKATRYLTLRQELHKRDSLINTVTLNAFLHDPHYVPSAPNMRDISDTYSVLLNDLNQAISEAKDPSA